MKRYAILALAMISGSAFAQQTFGMHMGTYHSANIECDNGNNPGVYYHASNGMTVGAYHNSCERQSAYVGYKTGDWRGLGVMAIAVTGYDRPITPVVFPTYSLIRYEKTKLRVSGGSWEGKTVVHFSAETDF